MCPSYCIDQSLTWMHSKSQENLLKADIWISIGKMLKTKRFFQDLCQEYAKSLSDFKGWVCARAEWVVKQNSQRESQKADIGSLEGGGSGSGHFLRFNWEGEKAMFTAPSNVYDVFTAVYRNNTNTTHPLCTTLPKHTTLPTLPSTKHPLCTTQQVGFSVETH